MTGHVSCSGLRLAGTVRRGTFDLDVDVHVAPGEVLGVLGPNGAGKSTLLRAVAGLVELSSGRLEVGGHAWQDDDVLVPVEERRTGVVFQDHRLFPHLDVLDNVAFGVRAGGRRRPEARRVARDWLERLDLAALADRRPHQLSGGQAQRVALARALARDPEVVLLDEPMAALDAAARIEVRAFLRRHLAEVAGPTVLVTHDPLEAMVLADRLLVLEHGRVVQEGSPADVARRPASAYVARLVGLNLWSGRLEDGGEVAVDGGGRLAATLPDDQPDDQPDDGARRPRPGDPVLVSLRPSAITVHAARPDHVSTRNVWPGRVEGLEVLADRVRLEVVGTPPALVDVTPAAVAELALGPGSPVWLSAKATETEAYAGLPHRASGHRATPPGG